LTVVASERVEVTGSNVNGSPSFLSSGSQGKGDAGDLTIETGQLLISDGALVTTTTSDEGAGGNLTVVASERVEVTGSNVNGSPSFLSSQSQGKGDAGELRIETRQLLISDGAGVDTSAFNEGAGGNLRVVASERVEVTGSNVNGSPSFLSSTSQGKGDAGNLTIETGQLLISNGASVTTSAFNEGAGGNLTVLASERVEVTGSDVIDGSPSFLGSGSQGKGDAGELRIETGQLLISDGAIVDTSAFNEGAGGNLTVVASERVQVTGSDM
jgi:large exoprotein involved in heme utilization and adhesion